MKKASWRKLSVTALDYTTEMRRVGAWRSQTAKDRRGTLLQWARMVDDPPMAALSHRHVLEFLTHGNAVPSTRRTWHTAMKAFCKWAGERGF